MSFALALSHPFPESPRVFLRDFAAPLAAFVSVFFLPGQWFLAGFLIIGQAHFVMTFLYQYRGGKMGRNYAVVAVAMAIILSSYFLLGGTFLPIFILTATLFAAHFANDEFALHDEKQVAHKFPAVILFSLLFLSLILYSLFPSFLWFAVVAGGVFAAYTLVRALTGGTLPASERYVFLVGSLLLILSFGAGVAPEILLSLVIILHCLNWYADYGRKVAHKEDAQKLSRYWLEVCATLMLSVGLYALYVVYGIPFLQFAFLPMYYDAWALAHFAFTVQTNRFPTS